MTLYLEEGNNILNVLVKDGEFLQLCDPSGGDFNSDFNNDFFIQYEVTYNYLLSLKHSGSTDFYYCYIYDDNISSKYMRFQISVTGSSTASTTYSVIPNLPELKGQWSYKIYPNTDFNYNTMVDPLDSGIMYIN